MNDGRVQQQPTDVALDRFGLTRCHSQEHLEFDSRLNSARLGEEPRIGDIKQVVPGHTDAHIPNPRGLESVVDHPLVVRVALLLGRPRREWPIVHSRLDAFHG